MEKELTESIQALKNALNTSTVNLMVNNSTNSEKLSKAMSDEMTNLHMGINDAVDRHTRSVMESTEKLIKTNEAAIGWMKFLAVALVMIGLANLAVGLLPFLK